MKGGGGQKPKKIKQGRQQAPSQDVLSAAIASAITSSLGTLIHGNGGGSSVSNPNVNAAQITKTVNDILNTQPNGGGRPSAGYQKNGGGPKQQSDVGTRKPCVICDSPNHGARDCKDAEIKCKFCHAQGRFRICLSHLEDSCFRKPS